MKNSFYSLAVLGMIAILVLAVWHLARRSAFVFGTRATWWYLGYGIAVVASFASMFMGAMRWSVNPVAHCFVVAGGVLTGFLLFLLIFTLLADLVQLVAHMPAWLFGTMVGSLALSFTVYGIVAAASPKIVEQTIALPKLSKPMRVVLLTDTHFGHYRGQRQMQHIVDKVNAANPDIVFFTGDCFESWYNFSVETVGPLRQLTAPVYFVDGNHDTYVNANQAKDLLRQIGVHVLENEVVEYAGLQIVGLDYMVADENAYDDMHAASGSETIKSVMQKMVLSDSLPTVVLHHSPMGANYIEAGGADLFLAGHTHGGQLWPVTWINNRLFQYNRGLYRLNMLQVYTSCGSGSFGPPLRLGTVSELTLIHLVPEASCQPDPQEAAIKTAIEQQLVTYPETTLQDVYKSFYQDRFGPGHMIGDTASARQYLMKEIAENDCSSKAYFEPTGSEGRFVRVYLSAVTDSLVTGEQLLDAFVASANQSKDASLDWASEWEKIVEVIRKDGVKVHDFEACLPMLSEAAKSHQAVHHSRAYNEAYHPHYRIVEKSLLDELLKR